MSNSIAFNNRNKSDFLNKKIREMLRESPQYDVDLLAANGKIVPAHRIVLSMYSKYLQKVLAHSTPDAKLIGKWKSFRNEVRMNVILEVYVMDENLILNFVYGSCVETIYKFHFGKSRWIVLRWWNSFDASSEESCDEGIGFLASFIIGFARTTSHYTSYLSVGFSQSTRTFGSKD